MIDLSSRVNIPEIYGRASAYPAADAPKPGKSAQSKPLRINLRLQVWLEADIAGEDVAKLGLQTGADLRVAPRSAVVFAMDKAGDDAAVQDRWVWPANSAALA